MAASLTISSASVASDGRTVTIAIGGSSGAITPSSGVTGFRVRATNTGTANTQEQASATISGTTLTITLSSFVSSTDTVVIDTIAGNLADGSGNTMVLANAQAVTNSSTKTATYFPVSNAAIYVTGYAAAGNNFGRNAYAYSGPSRQIDTMFTGTDASLCFYGYGTQSFKITIDGGTETTVTHTGIGAVAATTWIELPIASGLSNGLHRVRVLDTTANGNNHLDITNTLKVAGSSPSLTAPIAGNTAIDPRGTLYVIKQTGGSIADVDRTAAIRLDDNWSTLTGNSFYTAAANPCDIDFKATCSQINVYTKRGGRFALSVDLLGIQSDVAASASDLQWCMQTIATGLDGTAEHSYRLGFVNASNAVYAIEVL